MYGDDTVGTRVSDKKIVSYRLVAIKKRGFYDLRLKIR